MTGLYANVIIDISHESVDKTFQYRVPEKLRGTLKVGQQVYIPFGAGSRRRKGYVVELTDEPEYDVAKLKEIEGIVEHSVTAQSQLIWLAWWMKERYGSTMNQALKTVLPVKQKIKEAPKRQIRLIGEKEAFREAVDLAERRGYKARLRLFCLLKEKNPVPYDQAMNRLNLTPAVLKPLEEAGLIRVEIVEKYRNPLLEMKRLLTGETGRASAMDFSESSPIPVLNEEQQAAAYRICREYDRGIRATYLLHGITGSGKTEVYMELIRHVVEKKKQVILLIPEISLTWQTVMRFYKRFGNRVSLLHSRMSPGERYDQYERARTGDIDIMIGPRSALFAPFERLGLIIIDEEHESSYKQDERPNYHARTVALKRAQLSGIPVVLGSATPDLESFYKARQGTYTHLRLLQRANGSMLPHVEIADMRLELQRGNKSVLSAALNDALLQTAVQGEQAIVLLNRRGFSTFVMCRDCGESIVCPHCAVALVYHSAGEAMRCHYCGNTAPIPDECPNCHSRRIRFFGTGTQKAEAEIAELPEIRILRMDQDSTVKKFAHEDILKSFSSGEYNVLLGTQMVAKGHDIPNVTLVGILSADSTLNLPDFRASERTFALLTQAAGRAGRGDRAGHVVLQTYDPDNPVIKLAATQDYDAFAASELEIRQELGYPPYTEILKITVLDKEEVRGSSLAQRIVNFLQTLQLEHPEQELLVLGPFPAIVAKVRDLYRMNILVKCPQMELVKRALWNSEFKECRNVFFDVDPVSVV